VDPSRSLAAVHPELIDQWHYSRNAPLRVSPDRVSARSLLWVWWRCRSEHEWEESIVARADDRPRWKQGERTTCPFCAGHRGVRRGGRGSDSDASRSSTPSEHRGLTVT
jgi:hypothetical protein